MTSITASIAPRISALNLSPEESVLLLLDNVRIDKLKQHLYQLEDNPVWGYVYQDTFLQQLADAGAMWIETTINSPLWNHYLSEPNWRKSGAFFQSKAPLETRLTHLKSLTMVKEDESWNLFRFWSPFTLAVWLPSLTEDETTQLLGPMYTLGWIDSDGQAVGMTGPSDIAFAVKKQYHWQLSKAQIEALYSL